MKFYFEITTKKTPLISFYCKKFVSFMIFRLMISQYTHDKLLRHCSLMRCTVRSLYSTQYGTSHPTGSLYIYTSHIQWFSRHLCVCTSLQVQIDIVTCLSSVPYNNNSLVRERPLSTILIFRFTAYSLVCQLAFVWVFFGSSCCFV